MWAHASGSTGRRRSLRLLAATTAFGFGIAALPSISFADEGGVSFWIPGLFGSFAASPLQPGWALTAIGYYTNVSGGGAVGAGREVTIGKFPVGVTASLNVNLHGDADLALVEPTYTFATPVFGGQFQVGVLTAAGRSSAALAGTITAGGGAVSGPKTGGRGAGTA